MAINLNREPGQEITTEQILKSLEERRNLILDIDRENQEEGKISEVTEIAIESFLSDIEERRNRNELSEAQYWSQIVDLYSELFYKAQERLITEGHSREEASRFPLNPHAKKTEEIMAEAFTTAKRKISQPGMDDLRKTIKTRAQTLLNQNPNEN